MNADYTKIEQWWDVTTEGDCEGRTTKDLGKWFGDLDAIAHSLARKVYYGLRFKPLGYDTPACRCCGAPLTKRGLFPASSSVTAVDIQLDIDSGTWDLSPEDRRDVVAELFRDRPVLVEIGHYFGTVCLRFGDQPTPPQRGEGE
jgi:hypothetical protein